MGWIVIDYGKDQNTYRAFENKEDAKKEFIRTVQVISTMLEDKDADEWDADDWEELAEGGCYCHNGELQVEISRCDIYRNEKKEDE